MNFDRNILKLRKTLWCPLRQPQPFAVLRHQAAYALILVRAFYALYFFILTLHFTELWSKLPTVIFITPAWPIFWIRDLGPPLLWVKGFFFLNFVTTFLAMIWPTRRRVRLLAFIGTFFIASIYSSDIGGWQRMTCSQAYVLVTFLFIFLPDGERLRLMSERWRTTLIMAMVSVTVLLTYGSSGLWRLKISIADYFQGNNPMLAWDGLAIAIAGWKFTSGLIGPLGPFLIENRALSGPGIFLATALEISTIFVVWRPGLYRTWGILIMLFHLLIMLAMNLPFDENHLLVALFLVCSPFVGAEFWTWKGRPLWR